MADKWSVDWSGFEEVKKALDKWGNDVVSAATRAVDDCAEDLLSKAQALTFKKDGDLEASGTKDPVSVDPITKEISAQVGFNTSYAARRHEEPGHYDATNNPGPITRSKPAVDGMLPGRKYLERPLRKYMNKYLQDIADAIRGVGGAK